MRRLFLPMVAVAMVSCSNTSSSGDAGTDRLVPVDAGNPVDVPAPDVQAPDVETPDVPVVGTCRGPAEVAWTVDPRVCLVTFATRLDRPRGIAFAPNGDLFVVGNGRVMVLHDDDGDGTSGDDERETFWSVPGANHGIAFSPDGAFLYVSTPTDVYRMPYTRGLRVAPLPPTRVIRDMPLGGHSTRSLAFGPDGRLYVSVGSAGNLDRAPSELALRSMIRRFAVPATLTAAIDYAAGEVVASGMRNEAGLAFDRGGSLWGVENGRDNTVRPAGRDIHMDNPAEELNLIDTTVARFYGYPTCFSEGLLPGGAGPGTQLADPQSTAPSARDDAWCQDAANVRRPAFAMPAHWAPLGLTEYTGTLLPWRGSLIIGSHGSWNREAMQVGRLIARAEVAPDGTVRSVQPVVGELRNGALAQGTWGVKPVDIEQGPDGALYFSDDLGQRILRIGYR